MSDAMIDCAVCGLEHEPLKCLGACQGERSHNGRHLWVTDDLHRPDGTVQRNHTLCLDCGTVAPT